MKTLTFLVFMLLISNSFAQNNSITFNSTQGNYITAPHSSTLYPLNNFTIEFWMRTEKAFDDPMALINKAECITSNTSFTLQIKNDYKLRFGFNCNGNCSYTQVYDCSTAMTPGSCYHVALTYSSAGVKIYINGVLEPGSYTTGTGYCGTLHMSTEPLRIGTYRPVSDILGGFYDGLLDEIRLWNKVLTQSEIQTNYKNQLTGSETGLVLYYKLNELIVGPSVMIPNHATLSGSTLNGTTHSLNSTTPSTTNSCFNYTSLNSIDYENLINLYPNPTTGEITIESENFSEADVYDMYGACLQKAVKTKTISLKPFPSGVYFIHLKAENHLVVKKVVKL